MNLCLYGHFLFVQFTQFYQRWVLVDCRAELHRIGRTTRQVQALHATIVITNTNDLNQLTYTCHTTCIEYPLSIRIAGLNI